MPGPEQANPERQKADGWLLAMGGVAYWGQSALPGR